MTFDHSFARFADEVLPPDLPQPLASALRQLARPIGVARKHSPRLAEAADHLVFIASGATKLVAAGSAGSEQILSFQFAGDCVSVPHSAMHSYGLVALRNADILAFNANKLQALAAQHPGLSQALARSTISALHQCREHLLAVGRRSATERVASFLMAMRGVRQVAEDGGRTLNLIMTRREIADCLGLTVETVSRQFSKLRDLQLIETPSRTKVTLHDPAGLAVCAGSSVAVCEAAAR